MTPSLLPAYDRILDQLRSNGNKVRQTRPGQALAQCPAHEDRTASLSVTGIEGQVLVHCHAGCDTHDVLAALKMAMGDLFDNRSETVYRYDDGRRVRRSYTEDGTKQFSQFGTKNPTAVLYRLDKIQAAENGTPIYLVEGEKDVHAIESLGGIATTSPQGAQSFHKVDPTPLHGRNVLAVVDRDEKGKEWARQVRDKLDGKAKSVKFVQAKAGKDAADHIAADYSLAEFEPVELQEPVAARRARITWASEIEPQPVVWAWRVDDHGRIPSGSLSLAAGREGTGKSTFGVWLSAQITRGELPGSFRGQRWRVLYVAIEDSWKYTLVPRLIAAGADRSKVGRFDVVTVDGDDVTLSLPLDNLLLEREIVEHKIALVVIDPIMSVISDRIDTHRTHEVRRALDPLAKMADRTGAVILGIAHFNKASGTDAATLLSGSHAFRDVPRSIFGFARDDSDGTRVMTQVKNSLGRDDLPSFTYAIETAYIDTRAGKAETGEFVFTGESERSVADILRDSRGDSEAQEQRRDAASWIKTYLAATGGTAQVKDVLADGKAAGYVEQTLKNARSKVADTDSSGFGKDKVHFWILRVGTGIDTVGTTHKDLVPTVSMPVPTDEEPTVGTEELKNQRVSPSDSSMSSLSCAAAGLWENCNNFNCRLFSACVLADGASA